MHHDPSKLIVAISRAMNGKLDIDQFKDRLLIQKGCYILNRWGFGPFYEYEMYIRGPFSSELADDYYELNSIGNETDVSEDAIDKLSEILERGVFYTEAYATVLLIKTNNPGKDMDEVVGKTLDIKPHLKRQIIEASVCLAN